MSIKSKEKLTMISKNNEIEEELSAPKLEALYKIENDESNPDLPTKRDHKNKVNILYN